VIIGGTLGKQNEIQPSHRDGTGTPLPFENCIKLIPSYIMVNNFLLKQNVLQNFMYNMQLCIISRPHFGPNLKGKLKFTCITSGYATWFTAGGAIRIARYDVIDNVITRKL